MKVFNDNHEQWDMARKLKPDRDSWHFNDICKYSAKGFEFELWGCGIPFSSEKGEDLFYDKLVVVTPDVYTGCYRYYDVDFFGEEGKASYDDAISRFKEFVDDCLFWLGNGEVLFENCFIKGLFHRNYFFRELKYIRGEDGTMRWQTVKSYHPKDHDSENLETFLSLDRRTKPERIKKANERMVVEMLTGNDAKKQQCQHGLVTH